MFKHYISSQYPAHIIFIIEQSSIMSKPYFNGKTKAEYTTDEVNHFICNLILTCCASDRIKDWFYISVISHYDNNVKIIESKYLSEFAKNPLKIEKVNRIVSDGAGGWLEIMEEKPEYIKSMGTGISNLLSAFRQTRELILDWVNKKKYLSTLIINISCGYSSEWQMTTKVIEDIKSITLNGENPFLFNCLLDSNSSILEFPSLDIVYEKSFTHQLYFEWSSYMNEQMIDACSRYEFNVQQGGKLFSNKGISKLLNLINVGS